MDHTAALVNTTGAAGAAGAPPPLAPTHTHVHRHSRTVTHIDIPQAGDSIDFPVRDTDTKHTD